VVRDDKYTSGFRLSTQAFENDRRTDTPCSVAVRRVALPLNKMTERHPDRSLASITAGFVREHEQGVCFWEDPDEPGHAYLHGRKSKTILNALAAEAQFLAGPNQWGNLPTL